MICPGHSDLPEPRPADANHNIRMAYGNPETGDG